MTMTPIIPDHQEPYFTSLSACVVKRLQQVLDGHDGFVPLHAPHFAGAEWEYVKDCIDTGWVSTAGKFVERFESELAAFCGVKRAVAVCNGTAALHTCLMVSGVEPNDEVIIPTLTFVATANAVSYAHAVPHFADAEELTLGIDADKLAAHLEQISELSNGVCYNRQTGRKIAALVPMHTFGHPSNLDELIAVADRFHLTLIEDVAEALGSYYKDRHCGSFGHVNALSFNGNKIMTTGGGGALLTNDEAIADRAKHITTTAKLPHRWMFKHDEIGYNYRMPNLNAALGVAQLEQLPNFLQNKRALAQRYAEAFNNLEGIRFIGEPENCRSNYWLNALLLERGNESALEPILEATNSNNFMTRPAWQPMHQLPMYADCPKMDLRVAESLAHRLVNIPSSPQLLL